MKLQVRHRTDFSYAQPVTQSCNELRLKPDSKDGQICENFALKILPAVTLSDYLDFYFNVVHFFEILEPHAELSIESTADVITVANQLAYEAATTPLTCLTECARMEQCYDFLQSSSLVSVSPDIWRLAVDACQGQTDIWQSALAIMRFIHAGFAYVPSSTSVNTHMLEVLQQRRGVCQDFAHVMLGMCRAMKMPARYVSGYLYNGPAGGLLGAQASHAWCEIYLPGLGWRGLDPTNNQQADERYLRIAAGRDYADVAPIKGHYKGTSNRTMNVEVEIRALPPDPNKVPFG
ncbi:Transglutaminase domain protein [Verrucomicrobia bacterium]|nr:Transglutaminase domain protein [Verrucomicrobiota bacterium]